jgi:hypothetical protein
MGISFNRGSDWGNLEEGSYTGDFERGIGRKGSGDGISSKRGSKLGNLEEGSYTGTLRGEGSLAGDP